MKHKYNYFYKITNKINGHYYYGVHSTDNMNDGYMGSGTRLKKAFEKYGIENFEKEIIAQCSSRDEAYSLESTFVTESLIKDDDCYNIVLGGKQFTTEFLVSVKDKNGNNFLVHEKDPRYISGELVGVNKNKFLAVSGNGATFWASINDERLKNGLIRGINAGKVTVKDKNGNFFMVSVDDPRYTSGELVYLWKNRHHSAETKKKMSETHKKNHHQQGEKNSQYGTCWINNKKEIKKIKKSDLLFYEKNGWIRGRKIFNT